MKLNHIILIAAVAAGSMLVGCGNDQSNEPSFDNQLYIKAESMTEKIALRGRITEATRSLRLGVPKPAEQDINIACRVDASLTANYNKAFYDEAVMLPEEYFDFSTTEIALRKGTVLSDNIDVQFKNLDVLPRTQTYVLPVTVVSASNIPILQSRRTYYYVLKSSAMIEIVPDMEKKNFVTMPTFEQGMSSGEVCNNLSQFTWESLIRVHDFPEGIQSVMGMEGYFLIRVSDNGLKPNQLQIVTPYGNFTDAATCMLPTEEWVHIALTFDIATRMCVLYINGEVAATKSLLNPIPANFGKPFSNGNTTSTFRIGYSYAPGRELNGMISECRIWSVARTQEQIQENAYEVETNAPGLIAYWKLNEGRGKNVGDHTGNGNDGIAEANLKWVPVFLPEVIE